MAQNTKISSAEGDEVYTTLGKALVPQDDHTLEMMSNIPEGMVITFTKWLVVANDIPTKKYLADAVYHYLGLSLSVNALGRVGCGNALNAFAQSMNPAVVGDKLEKKGILSRAKTLLFGGP